MRKGYLGCRSGNCSPRSSGEMSWKHTDEHQVGIWLSLVCCSAKNKRILSVTTRRQWPSPQLTSCSSSMIISCLTLSIFTAGWSQAEVQPLGFTTLETLHKGDSCFVLFINEEGDTLNAKTIFFVSLCCLSKDTPFLKQRPLSNHSCNHYGHFPTGFHSSFSPLDFNYSSFSLSFSLSFIILCVAFMLYSNTIGFILRYIYQD